MSKSYLQLVAIIWPKYSWGIKCDPNELARLAENAEECPRPTLCRVGPTRNDPSRIGVWGTFTDGDKTMEEWDEVKKALDRPVLYRADIAVFDGSLSY